MLIRDGAKIVLCAEDILEEFYISFNRNTTSSAKRQLSLNGLNTDELMVVKELEGGVMHMDQLSERLNMDFSSLGSTLLMLELKGVVEEIPGKRFKLMQSIQVFKS
jgi:DNA processing protein